MKRKLKIYFQKNTLINFQKNDTLSDCKNKNITPGLFANKTNRNYFKT